MKELKLAIIRMYQDGIPMREISRLLDVPKPTAIDDIKHFEETGTNEDRAGRGRKKGYKNNKKPSTNAEAESNDQKKLIMKAGQKTGDF